MKKIYHNLSDNLYIGGIQIFGNLYGIQNKYLKNQKMLEQFMRISAKVAKVHIIKFSKHTYKIRHGDIAGVSLVAFLEESHMVLHTWPEGNYVTIDIFSCGKRIDTEMAFYRLVSLLKPKSYKSYVADRGYTIKSI